MGGCCFLSRNQLQHFPWQGAREEPVERCERLTFPSQQPGKCKDKVDAKSQNSACSGRQGLRSQTPLTWTREERAPFPTDMPVSDD